MKSLRNVPKGKGLVPVELVWKIHTLIDATSSISNSQKTNRSIPATFKTFDGHKTNIDLNVCRPLSTCHNVRVPKEKELENIEDLIIVWLDQDVNQTEENISERKVHLRQIINCLKTFDNTDRCLRYVQSIKEEKILVITSGSLGKIVINELSNYPQVLSVYIYCFDAHEHELWTKDYPKVVGIFTSEHQLITQITKDVSSFFRNNFSVDVINSVDISERSVQDVTKDQARFMWSQILIGILFRLPQTSQSKNELIQECRRYYRNNKYQQTKITEFEKTYTSATALGWYTRDSFLYRIVNKALRTQNILYIFKCRFFIIDLYQQLTKIHRNFLKTTSEKIITVYRGQLMASDEFCKLQNNINGFISINTFFSTSHSSMVALNFAGDGSARPIFESVYFEIELDLNINEAIFANVNKLSQYQSENELVLCIGTILRIETVEPLSDSVWYVKLMLTSGNEVTKLEQLKQHFLDEVDRASTYLALGKILLDMGEYDKAQTYYELLLTELPSNHPDTAAIYSDLGTVIMSMQKDFQLALTYLRQSLTLQLKRFPDNLLLFIQTLNSIAAVQVERRRFKSALTLYRFTLEILDSIEVERTAPRIHQRRAEACNNIGYIYSKIGRFDLSLKYYRISLTIERKILPSNHPNIALSLNNIGMIYLRKLDSKTAEKYLQEANAIRQESLPFEYHPDLAQMYNNLGSMYYHRMDFDEALIHFQKALEIQLKCLPPIHPHTAMLYNSIGNVYSEKKDYSKALEMYENSLKIGQQCWPPFHPEISEAYGNIGTIYWRLKDYEKALSNCEKALDIGLKCLPPTHSDLAEAYRCVGRVHTATDNHAMALIAYQKAMDIYIGNPPLDQGFLGTLFQELGNEHYEQGSYQDALRCLRKALEIYQSCKLEESLFVMLYYQLGKAFYRTSEYDNALLYYNKCLHFELLTQTKSNFSNLSQTYHAIGETFEKLNDYRMAFKNYATALETIRKDVYTSTCIDNATLIEQYQKSIELVKTFL